MDTDARVATKEREEESQQGIRLPAFEDKNLSAESQEHLAKLLADHARVKHRGKDLPSVATEDLLEGLQ